MSDAVYSPDLVTIITNVGVFVAAVGTVIAAIWSAAKKVKSAMPDQREDRQRVIGGMILDNTTLLLWSESNRDVVAVMQDVKDEMKELRFALTQLKDKM